MTSPARRTRWNEARIARELETWFAERNFDRWPTYRTFVRDGHKRLYTAILDSGGADRWAAELGVPHIPHKTGGGLSSDETRAALRQLLRTHRPTRFPTLAWLERHGPAGLAAAVTRTGGGAHWASMLNMPPAAPARWTDERIEAELRRICHNVEAGPPATSSAKPAPKVCYAPFTLGAAAAGGPKGSASRRMDCAHDGDNRPVFKH